MTVAPSPSSVLRIKAAAGSKAPSPASLKDRVLQAAKQCAAASRPLAAVEANYDVAARLLDQPSHLAALVDAAALTPSIARLDLRIATPELLASFLAVPSPPTTLTSLSLAVPSLAVFTAVPPSAPSLSSITKLVLSASSAAPDPATTVGPALNGLLAHFPETRSLETYFGSENHSLWGAAALDAVATRCPHLADLDTRGTGGYSHADIDRFMSRLPHLTALSVELSDDAATAAWAADEIADAPWWARLQKVTVGPNEEVGFFYRGEDAVKIVSRLRGVTELSVAVDADCVVAVAEAVVRVAAASVEEISLVGVGLGDPSARMAVEHVVANKPSKLKAVVCSEDVDDEGDAEYQKIVALAASAGVSLEYRVDAGQGPPEVVTEML
ncbi:hypothetical protein DFJ73DRAFT_851520 [Zopfochytrium polystomum]|nr:hypothetical protein DFJ73DRAFT_851520 [Zopfochytrium polystomum]